jgi:hypothetical protein
MRRVRNKIDEERPKKKAATTKRKIAGYLQHRVMWPFCFTVFLTGKTNLNQICRAEEAAERKRDLFLPIHFGYPNTEGTPNERKP